MPRRPECPYAAENMRPIPLVRDPLDHPQRVRRLDESVVVTLAAHCLLTVRRTTFPEGSHHPELRLRPPGDFFNSLLFHLEIEITRRLHRQG
jgi:hypothetical protein